MQVARGARESETHLGLEAGVVVGSADDGGGEAEDGSLEVVVGLAAEPLSEVGVGEDLAARSARRGGAGRGGRGGYEGRDDGGSGWEAWDVVLHLGGVVQGCSESSRAGRR